MIELHSSQNTVAAQLQATLQGLQGSRTEPCNQVNIIADGDNNLLLIIVNNSGVFF